MPDGIAGRAPVATTDSLDGGRVAAMGPLIDSHPVAGTALPAVAPSERRPLQPARRRDDVRHRVFSVLSVV
jgi:hypothetical protein